MSNKDLRHKKNKSNSILSSSIAEHDPLYGCWINQEWKSAGYAYIVVARKRKTGLIAFAAFWIDVVKGIIEKCVMEWNCTEEFFQKNILKKNSDIAFLGAELSVVRDIVMQADSKMQKNEKTFPDVYPVCKTILGAEQEKILEEKHPESIPEKNLKISYTILNQESVEADLRQIGVLEESEESQPGYRCFDWKEEKKRGFFSISKEKFFLGKVVLENNKLWPEVFDEKNAQYLQNSLLQYLGTTIC